MSIFADPKKPTIWPLVAVGRLVVLVAAVGAAALVFLSLGGSTGWVVAVCAVSTGPHLRSPPPGL